MGVSSIFFLRYFPIIIRTDHAFDFPEMEGSGRWLVMYWSVKKNVHDILCFTLLVLVCVAVINDYEKELGSEAAAILAEGPTIADSQPPSLYG